MNKKVRRKKNENLICQFCGKQDETVQEIECGYVRELYNESSLEIICDECEYEHIMDI